MTRRVVIVGAGGHGRVLGDMLALRERADSDERFVGWLDAELEPKTMIMGRPVLGDDDQLRALVRAGTATHAIVGVGAVRGGALVRRRLAERILEAGAELHALIHPSAILASNIVIGPGAAIMAGCTVNTGARIGRNAIVNTGAVIDHDARIGEYAHIAPGAVLSGEVTIGDGAMVGAGAVCKQGVTIGENATVGAGGVVVNDVEAMAVVVGSPAREPD